MLNWLQYLNNFISRDSMIKENIDLINSACNKGRKTFCPVSLTWFDKLCSIHFKDIFSLTCNNCNTKCIVHFQIEICFQHIHKNHVWIINRKGGKEEKKKFRLQTLNCYLRKYTLQAMKWTPDVRWA